MMTIGPALLGAVTGTFASWLLQTFAWQDDESPREAEPPGGLSKVFADPARDQTWTRSSTTFAIFAMASSNGMPFSCEPSR